MLLARVITMLILANAVFEYVICRPTPSTTFNMTTD
jgi:hypothetical protein